MSQARSLRAAGVAAGLILPLLAAAPPAAAARRHEAATRAAAVPGYGRLPLRFEANVGQGPAEALFVSRGSGHTLHLERDSAVVALRGAERSLRMTLLGGRAGRVVGDRLLPGHSHYYLGDDPKRWRTGVPSYAAVRYEQVYPGIDLVYYGNERQLEYDFVVAPGSHPGRIAFALEGADALRLSEGGDLIARVGSGEVRHLRPIVYQEVAGQRRSVEGGYVVRGNEVRFRLGAYDSTRPLVIDPLIDLAYSTYVGGSSFENSVHAGIAIDGAGAAYIVGNTLSADLPGATNAKPAGPTGDIFVAKLNSAGDAILYATYLGGPTEDEGHDIGVDAAGNAYISGFTHGTGFPVTMDVFQPTFAGGLGDAIVAKFNPDGTLAYSSYLGGVGAGIDRSYERGHSIAVDGAGHAYVTGGSSSSSRFPIVGGVQSAPRGNFDVFVTKVSPDGRSLVYSTLFGAPGPDIGYEIAIDEQGAAYVTGWTQSFDNAATPAVNENFPTTPGALQRTYGGGSSDGFLFKLNPEGNQVVFSTYLGGSLAEFEAHSLVAPTGGLAVDGEHNVYVTANTRSSNFPTTPNRVQGFGGSHECFLTKIAPGGDAIVYSTFLGSPTAFDFCMAVGVDPTGSAYVAGFSNRGWPLVNALPPTATLNTNNGTGNDAIVVKLSPDGGTLVYSTYLGGRVRDQAYDMAVDAEGHAYITGVTHSLTWPLVGPADSTCANCAEGFFEGSSDAFVAKLELTHAWPLSAADAFTTPVDTPLAVPAPGVLANDTDDLGAPLTARLARPPAHGVLTLSLDGSFSYTPPAGFRGTDSFSYRARDTELDGLPAEVTIAVVNRPPTAAAGGPYEVDEGASLTLAGAGTDPEGGALTFAWDLDGDGSFETEGQTATFTATDGPRAAPVFLRVTDDAGATAIDATTVTIRNLPARANADAFIGMEDTPLVVAAPGVLGNDEDLDPLTAVLATPPAHGTLTLEMDGSFRYVPEPDFHGADGFTYRAHDGDDPSEAATVSLTVNPVNDAPTASAGGPYTVEEGRSLTLVGRGADVDGAEPALAWDLDGDGVFEASGSSVPFAAGDGPATRTVVLRATDAEGAFATSPAVVSVLNVAPVAAPDAFAATAGETLTVPAPGVLANDQDFDPLAAVLVSGPTQGTLTLGADGALHYVAGATATGTDTFSYAASDGLATSAPATVTITLAPAAGGPDARDDSFVIAKRRHRPQVLDVLANDDPGPSGAALVITGVTPPLAGTVRIGPGGRSVVFHAPRHFRGHTSFAYTVRDARGATDTATVDVTVARNGRGHGGRDQDGHDDDDDGDR